MHTKEIAWRQHISQTQIFTDSIIYKNNITLLSYNRSNVDGVYDKLEKEIVENKNCQNDKLADESGIFLYTI